MSMTLNDELFQGLLLALAGFLFSMALTPFYTHFAYKYKFWKKQKKIIEIMKNFTSILSEKICYLNKKIVSYTAGSTDQKLAYFIGENSLDGVFCADVSISDIAIMLNMGRASLYRAFHKLSEDGYIQKDGRKIHLQKKEALLQAYQ